jgi:hypothetical protein
MLFHDLQKTLAELDALPAVDRHGVDIDPEIDRAIELLGAAAWEAEEAAYVKDACALMRDKLEQRLDEELAELAVRKPTTSRVYLADVKRFTAFCVERDLPALPAAAETVAWFLLDAFDNGASLATVRRLNAAVGWAHRIKELFDPTPDVLVRSAVRHVAKLTGMLQVARPGEAVPEPIPAKANGNAQFEGAAVPDDDDISTEVH